MSRGTENQQPASVVTSAEFLDAPFDAKLWRRLEQFSLDVPENGLTFTQRLARDNAWSLSYARRACDEYKKFIYLAKKAGHVVCPSDAVDQVWHMHLTYTRSYWGELCGEVLNMTLHHGPTKGGSQEQDKFYRLYENTQQSYQRHFGAPPEDIWPPADVRFGADLHYVRVNARNNYVIPKPTWLFGAKAIAGTVAVSALFPLAQLVANPLDWSGPQFLALYFGLLVAAALVCVIARLATSFSDPLVSEAAAGPQVGPIETAWLKGGNALAATTALVDLEQARAVELVGTDVQAGSHVAAVNPKHRVQKVLLQEVASSGHGSSWQRLQRDVRPAMLQMRQELEGQGLVVSSTQANMARALPFILLGSLFAFGLLKVIVGLSRGRPVGFLLVGEVAAVACLAAFLATIPRLTPAGKRLLRERASRTELARDVKNGEPVETGLLSDSTLVWSTALIGTAALSDTQFSPLAQAQTQWGGSAGSSAGGCSAGDGGGGCGGGGCGGGCGGCGG